MNENQLSLSKLQGLQKLEPCISRIIQWTKIVASGKFCLLAAFALAVAPLCAQPFERVEDRGTHTLYTSGFLYQDSMLVVAGSSLECGWFHFVQCFDFTGDLLWSFDGNNKPLTNVLVFPTVEDQMVVFGFMNGGDLPIIEPYFQLISNSGILISEYLPSDDFDLQFSELIEVKPVNIGEQVAFIAFTSFPIQSYQLVSFAIDGSLLFNTSLGNSPVHHLRQFGDYFAVFTEDELILIDTAGNIETEIPYPTAPVHVLVLPNGRLMTAGENGFTELDETMQWSEVSISLSAENLVEWSEYDNRIYMLADSEILVYDLNYLLLATIPHELLPHLEVIDFTCRTGYCAILGARVQAPSTPSLNKTAVVYTVSTSEDAEPGGDTYPDVALHHLNITSQSVTISANNGSVVVGFTSGQFETYLVNYGNIPIQEVNITSNFNLGFAVFCFAQFAYTKAHFENLNLAPGDSTLVTGEYQRYFAVSVTQFPLNIGVCAVSSVPNQLSDRDASNDMACASVQITVSVNQVQAPQPLSLFPNPSSSTVTLQLPGRTLTYATLHDMQGREVLSVLLSPVESVVDVRHLPKGMYVLRATEAGGGVYVKKMVVE